MKQNHIFVIILLATLSMVNAIPYQFHKRATTFVPCLTGSPNEISVGIQPDPPVRGSNNIFTISGTLKTGTLSAGSKLVIAAIDNTGSPLGDPVTSDICSTPNMTCPATTFSIIATVPFANLPATYSIIVQIL